MHIRTLSLLHLLAIHVAFGQLAFTGPFSLAGDWPQILGPQRNGIAADERIRTNWGREQPRLVWEYAVGQGYAGPAVSGGRVVIFHRRADEEVVDVLDASSGDLRWSQSWPTNYRSRLDPDAGPRCVPLVDEGRVYLHGVAGRLVCLSFADGKVIWARDTRADFAAREGYFGAGSSPLIVDEKLIVNVGGRDDRCVVAFSKHTGDTLWTAFDDEASYSSPVVSTIDRQQHVLLVTRMHLLSLDPSDGRQRFQLSFGRRGPTVNAANPVLVGPDGIFLSASYGIGARLARIAGDQAEYVWSRDDVLSSQYVTAIHSAGVLYGVDGRQDGPAANLRACDPQTGDAHWTKERFGMATLMLVGDSLLAMKTDGECVLVGEDPTAYRELARFRLTRNTTRALPALAGGRLFVRDTTALGCFDFRLPD